MKHKYTDVVALAKTVTELSIQNKIFAVYEDPEDTAKEIAKFYNAFVEAIDNSDAD